MLTQPPPQAPAPAHLPDDQTQLLRGQVTTHSFPAGQWWVDVGTQLPDPSPGSLVLNPSPLVLPFPQLCSRKSAGFLTGRQSEAAHSWL